ncbi:MAG: hypothetical protein ABSG41_08860 [Bryobacteraceae bacterium]|jgi:hypothetical protein
MKETRVLQALGALAENDRQTRISPVVEARLIEAFRTRRPKRAFPFRAVCSVAIAAALVTVIIVDRPQKPQNAVSKPSVDVVSPPSREAAIEIPKASEHPVRPAISKRVRKPTQVKEQTAQEVVTDFFPLMDPAPPFGRGEILRVELPATAMQAVGLPVGDDHLADRVQADVLVGEEGLPRAIRFVGFEMK